MSQVRGPSGRGRVFLSHSSSDADRAALLCLQLESEGIKCWIAPRDIPSGHRYGEAIVDGIDECSVFVLLYSEAAGNSTHVANELEHGASLGKPILVIRTDAADPGQSRQVSLFVRSHQWFDASRGPLSVHLERLVHDLRQLLDESSADSRSVPTVSSVDSPIPVPTSVTPSAAVENANRSIGIEVGASRIRGCVVNLDGARVPPVIEQITLAPNVRSGRGVLDAAKAMAQKLIDEQFAGTRPIGIGVAVPGQVDLRAGTLKFGPNLFGSRNLPFKTLLSGAFPGIPVRVDNEVRCATRCELHLGVGSQFDSFACVFVGTGVGSGIVIDKRIHFGSNFCAGELGHMKVALSGPPCACGQIGCLETFVKAQAIVDRARAIAIDWESRGRPTLLDSADQDMTPEKVVAAVDAGDAAAAEIAVEVGAHLGLGISNYLNLVNPGAVVIGGGLMTGFFFHMIDEISVAIQRNALAEVANTPIVQSSHTDDGIATGAALMFDPSDRWPFQ
ncbi:ROK family protein [Mycobacterium sp. NPDC051198]